MGMGLSGRPNDWDYCLATHQATLEALVQSLDLTDVSLLVHDWGGPIGLGVAARNPERFARYVITEILMPRRPALNCSDRSGDDAPS